VLFERQQSHSDVLRWIQYSVGRGSRTPSRCGVRAPGPGLSVSVEVGRGMGYVTFSWIFRNKYIIFSRQSRA